MLWTRSNSRQHSRRAAQLVAAILVAVVAPGCKPRQQDAVATTAPTPTAQGAVVVSKLVNCRAEPNADSAIVDRFTQNTRLKVFDVAGDWTKVALQDAQCWVRSSLISTSDGTSGGQLNAEASIKSSENQDKEVSENPERQSMEPEDFALITGDTVPFTTARVMLRTDGWVCDGLHIKFHPATPWQSVMVDIDGTASEWDLSVGSQGLLWVSTSKIPEYKDVGFEFESRTLFFRDRACTPAS